MRLAGHLKWRSIREGLEANTSREIEEWFAFYRIEPYGQEWLQSAQIAGYIAAANGAKNVRFEDLMPVARKQTASEVFGVFQSLYSWMVA